MTAESSQHLLEAAAFQAGALAIILGLLAGLEPDAPHYADLHDTLTGIHDRLCDILEEQQG
jgi:hypothetical protein